MKAFPFLNNDGAFDEESIKKHLPALMAYKGLTEEEARAQVMSEARRQQREYNRAKKEVAPNFPKREGNVLKEMFAHKYQEYDSSWR